MNQFQTLQSTHGYALTGLCLEECKVVRATYKFCTDDNKFFVASYTVDIRGKIGEVSPDNLFYSVDDYKAGKPAELYYNCYLTQFFNIISDEEKGMFYTWIIDDGKPTKINVQIDEFVVFYNGESGHRSQIEVKAHQTAKCMYESEEDARNHIDITIKHADGTTEEIIGISNLIALTKQQKKIVGQIADLIKQARDIGVNFVLDNSYESLYAFNGDQIGSICYDFEANDGYEHVDFRSKEFALGISIPTVSEDCILNLKRK